MEHLNTGSQLYYELQNAVSAWTILNETIPLIEKILSLSITGVNWALYDTYTLHDIMNDNQKVAKVIYESWINLRNCLDLTIQEFMKP